VGEVYAPNHSFKSSWFWAVEDWWIDDVGSLVANGIDTATAQSRRDGYNNRTYSRRSSSQQWNSYAWSWHEG
jgi:hypothetical protein